MSQNKIPQAPAPAPAYYTARVTLDFTKSNAKLIIPETGSKEYDQKITIEYEARRMDESEVSNTKAMLDGFDDELVEIGMARIADLLTDLFLIQIIKSAKK